MKRFLLALSIAPVLPKERTNNRLERKKVLVSLIVLLRDAKTSVLYLKERYFTLTLSFCFAMMAQKMSLSNSTSQSEVHPAASAPCYVLRFHC